MKNTPSAITLQTTVNVSVEKCWKIWTTPGDILQFNNPFDDWHTAKVEIDLREQGRLYYRMEAKNGSEGFDFGGKYDRIITNELIEYTGDDGRKSVNTFTSNAGSTIITETFVPEQQTPVELQKEFVQNILNAFREYAEEKEK